MRSDCRRLLSRVLLCQLLLLSLRCDALRTPPPPQCTATVSLPAAAPLQWREQGDHTWLWSSEYWPEPITVNYIAAGDEDAPPVLLIHGFGASGFHFRNNINVLAAAGHRVYAIDLLGFGLTDKPVLEYKASIWRDQCVAFLSQVAGCKPGRRAVVAGNSIGGFTALSVAAGAPELVRGCVSINGAGRFKPPPEVAAALAEQEAEAAARPALRKAVDEALEAVGKAIGRAVVTGAFYVTKQPARIKQVLRQVYPVTPEAACDELVASIEYPARDPNAPEVFYRIVSRNGAGPPEPLDDLVQRLECPLQLLWGEKDPWIVSATGDRLEQLARSMGKDVTRTSLDAGHCPMDEAPEAANAGMLAFIQSLPE